jgi:MycE methyltransferase N-terminal
VGSCRFSRGGDGDRLLVMGYTDSGVTDRLVRAGVGLDEEIAGLVEDVGLKVVAAALMEEVIFRCAEPVHTTPMNVGLRITHGGERWQSVLRLVRDEPVRLVEDEEPTLHMQLEMSATDLIRRLFGRSRDRRTGDFGNTFLPVPSPSLYDLVPAS